MIHQIWYIHPCLTWYVPWSKHIWGDAHLSHIANPYNFYCVCQSNGIDDQQLSPLWEYMGRQIMFRTWHISSIRVKTTVVLHSYSQISSP